MKGRLSGDDIASQGTVIFSPPMPPISSLLSQISESLSSSPSNLEPRSSTPVSSSDVYEDNHDLHFEEIEAIPSTSFSCGQEVINCLNIVSHHPDGLIKDRSPSANSIIDSTSSTGSYQQVRQSYLQERQEEDLQSFLEVDEEIFDDVSKSMVIFSGNDDEDKDLIFESSDGKRKREPMKRKTIDLIVENIASQEESCNDEMFADVPGQDGGSVDEASSTCNTSVVCLGREKRMKTKYKDIKVNERDRYVVETNCRRNEVGNKEMTAESSANNRPREGSSEVVFTSNGESVAKKYDPKYYDSEDDDVLFD